MRNLSITASTIIGMLLLPAIWLFLHYYVGISERFLPSPVRVFGALYDLKPSIFMHVLYTTVRLVIGSSLGVTLGILLGLLLYRSQTLYRLLAPSVQSLRATPPVAAVPFFLLWFGFSEIGRYVLIVFGIGLGISIATYQILDTLPEKYKVLFKSFALDSHKHVFTFGLPLVLEKILPTIRFSLATAVGLVIVSEFLGSQVGLGHLIQTARSTFALHTVFLAMILLGVTMVLLDHLVAYLWRKCIYWQ